MSGRRDTRRRLEQWLANPACAANAVSAVAGVSMADVAVAEGLEPTMGQSPFAIARGVTFEASLLRDDAKTLREELARVGIPGGGTPGLLDLRLRMNGGPISDHETAWTKTRDWLLAAASTPKSVAPLVASATLKVPGQPILLPEGVLAVDVLLLHSACRDDELDEAPIDDPRWVLRIGEVKSYPDRGGYTDAGNLAGSRAQAGTYHHALELLLDELELRDQLRVFPYGFLVLSQPGRAAASVRAREDLRFQARRAKRGFTRLRAVAAQLQPFDPADEDAARAAVLAAEVAYDPTCLGFCDRAAGCRKRAEAAGEPAILGQDTARFLAGLTIPRALELLRGAAPADAAERDFVRRADVGVRESA